MRRRASHANPNGPVYMACTACGQPFMSIKEFYGHGNCRPRRGGGKYMSTKQRTHFPAPKAVHAEQLPDGTVAYVPIHATRLPGDSKKPRQRPGRKRQE